MSNIEPASIPDLWGRISPIAESLSPSERYSLAVKWISRSLQVVIPEIAAELGVRVPVFALEDLSAVAADLRGLLREAGTSRNVAWGAALLGTICAIEEESRSEQKMSTTSLSAVSMHLLLSASAADTTDRAVERSEREADLQLADAKNMAEF